MGELASMLGMANAGQTAAGAGIAGSAAGQTAAGATQMSAGAGEMFGALSGDTTATVAGGAAKAAQGASMIENAGGALSGASEASNLGSAAHEAAHVAEGAAAADNTFLAKMKSVGADFANGLFTNDKVFTPGFDGKGVDWTATISKAAGRVAQGKLNRALGGGKEAEWKKRLALDMYDSTRK